MPTATTPAASGAGGRNNAKSQHQGESVNQTPGYPDPSNKKATSTSLTLDTPFAVEPMWLTELLKKYLGGVANVFVLEGNTHDYYQYMGEKLRGCLVSTLTSKQLASGNPLFGVVVTFSRYARFAFPTDGMRDKFLEIANKQATTVKLPTTLTADNLNTLVGQYGMSFAMAVLTNVLAYKGKEAVPVAIILEYADTLVPASEGALGEQDRTIYTALSDIAKDQIVGAAGNLGRQHHLVVMVSEEPNGLYAPLRRTIREVLTIPMPDGVLRTAFIPVVKASHRKVGLAEGLSDHKLANLTAGLTLRQIEDIFLIAAKEGQAVDVPLVRKRKDELIKNEYGDVLTITDPRMSFAGLGGMTTIKAYLTDKVVRPMQAGKLKRVPNGLLLSGPAGTGKTALAEALAGEIGTSFVKFNIAKIKDKYVGQSERNMQRALDMLEVINPAVIFIDELDQMISQQREGGGDSGVSNNLFAMLLSWAADTSRRGRVLLVGATNRPDLLDAALKREGRFDLKIPVLAPEKEERPEIMAVQLGRYFPEGVELPTEMELAGLTESMHRYTGAILETIASLAYGEWEDAGGQMSVLEALEEATASFCPTTQEIEAMTKLAIETTSDLRVLPERLREELAEQRKERVAEAGDLTSERYTRSGRTEATF